MLLKLGGEGGGVRYIENIVYSVASFPKMAFSRVMNPLRSRIVIINQTTSVLMLIMKSYYSFGLVLLNLNIVSVSFDDSQRSLDIS